MSNYENYLRKINLLENMYGQQLKVENAIKIINVCYITDHTFNRTIERTNYVNMTSSNKTELKTKLINKILTSATKIWVDYDFNGDKKPQIIVGFADNYTYIVLKYSVNGWSIVSYISHDSPSQTNIYKKYEYCHSKSYK